MNADTRAAARITRDNSPTLVTAAYTPPRPRIAAVSDPFAPSLIVPGSPLAAMFAPAARQDFLRNP